MVALQKQKYRHRPDDGEIGDCHRTAIAMMMGLSRDDVPHFLHDNCNSKIFRQRVDDYLSAHGRCEVGFPLGGKDVTPEHVLECIAVWAPKTPVILGGTSRTGCNHSVVVFEGSILDPSLDNSGIVGPCDDGFYWCTLLPPLPRWLVKPPE
jgi:hypothetical protein